MTVQFRACHQHTADTSSPILAREPLLQLLALGLAGQVQKFKAMKCLSVGIEVTESVWFFSHFWLARMMSPGGKAAAFLFVPSLPLSTSWLCGVAAPLSPSTSRLGHQRAGLGLHFSLCSLLGAAKEWEELE